MSRIHEFRVILPMTVEEYQIAQLYSVAEASKNETGGGDGIEVIENHGYGGEDDEKCETRPVFKADGREFTKGQYTYKKYHLEKKVPRFVRVLAKKGSLTMIEEAYNAYPYCQTCVTNEYMGKYFFIDIITFHKADRGTADNIHNLTPEQLRIRKVTTIDIANDYVSNSDYKKEDDPKLFKSEKTGRGPLSGKWTETVEPVMCAYKLVLCEFKWFGLQTAVERLIMDTEKRLFTNFHRMLFCSMDKWHGLTMQDIRKIEDQTKEDLESLRKDDKVRGMVEK